MADARMPFTRKSGTGRSVAVVGDVYTFFAVGAETDGKYALWEALVAPGGGPPPHIHSREEEGFLVLDGAVRFFDGKSWHDGPPGTFFHMPVGSLHTFRNETKKPARVLIWVAPAGLEEMFFEVGQPVADPMKLPDPPSADEIGRLLERAPQYGIEIQLPA